MKLATILEAGFVDYTREDDTENVDGNDPQQSDTPGDDQSDRQDDDGDTQRDDNPDGQSTGDDDAKQGDPDRQGSIRTVPDAHLVYKRKNENNLYDELWIYKQNQHDTWTMKTYDAILAGSDIPKGASTSEDNTQSVERWEVGDPKDTLVFVNIIGLAN